MFPYDSPEEEQRKHDRWYRESDNQPVYAGQFWALWDSHQRDFNDLKHKVEEINERMLDERAKQFVGMTFTTIWGRILVVIIAVLSAFFLTRFGLPSWLP